MKKIVILALVVVLAFSMLFVGVSCKEAAEEEVEETVEEEAAEEEVEETVEEEAAVDIVIGRIYFAFGGDAYQIADSKHFEAYGEELGVETVVEDLRDGQNRAVTRSELKKRWKKEAPGTYNPCPTHAAVIRMAEKLGR